MTTPDRQVHEYDSASLLEILDISRRLASPLPLRELLELVIDAGRSVLRADRGAIFLHDRANHELYSVVASGEQEIRFPSNIGIAGQCLQTREVVNVGDCQNDPRFNVEIDRATGYVTRCLIAVPLIASDNELVGVLELLNAEDGSFSAGDERLAVVLASQAAVAIQRTQLMDERLVRVKLQRELDLARQIQQRLLPMQLPAAPGYDLAVYNEPADQTGGDLYDVVLLSKSVAGISDEHLGESMVQGNEDGLLLVLADATGHGIGPALTITLFRALLRMGVRTIRTMNALMGHINQQLVQDLPDNRFITAFVGTMTMARHELVFQSAGQGPLMHYHCAKDEVEWMPATTLPLGVVDDLPLDEPQRVCFARGDIFVLLTDGFYERLDETNRQFGEDRVAELVREHHHEPASVILQKLVEAVKVFAGNNPKADDLTAIIVKRLG